VIKRRPSFSARLFVWYNFHYYLPVKKGPMIMKKNLAFSILALSILLVTLVAGCAPAQPTQDPAAIYTMVAETIQAQFSQTALAKPTKKPTKQPTNEPTFTSPTPTETQTPAGGLPTVDPNTATPELMLATATQAIPTPTLPAATAARSGDSAFLGYQIIADNTTFKPLQTFHQAFGLVNNGTTTWNPNYCLVFGAGKNPGGINSLCVDKNVAPGEKYEFFFYFTAPENDGKYISRWFIKNAEGYSFYEVYFAFVVAK
jgi:hypothetical protein